MLLSNQVGEQSPFTSPILEHFYNRILERYLSYGLINIEEEIRKFASHYYTGDIEQNSLVPEKHTSV
jgi:hypothetical protein